MVNKIKTFLKEVNNELKKVAWPNRKNVITMTQALLACIFVVSAFIFGMDVIFGYITNLVK